jgi:hypothetical protein
MSGELKLQSLLRVMKRPLLSQTAFFREHKRSENSRHLLTSCKRKDRKKSHARKSVGFTAQQHLCSEKFPENSEKYSEKRQ